MGNNSSKHIQDDYDWTLNQKGCVMEILCGWAEKGLYNMIWDFKMSVYSFLLIIHHNYFTTIVAKLQNLLSPHK